MTICKFFLSRLLTYYCCMCLQRQKMHSVIVEKEEIKIKDEVENDNLKDLSYDHLSDLSIKHNSKIDDDNQQNYEELTNIIDPNYLCDCLRFSLP